MREMELEDLRKNWDLMGKNDPLWSDRALFSKGEKVTPDRIKGFFESGAMEIDSVMSYVESIGVTVPKRKALDFGCGAGRLAQRLAYYFDEVIGVDISQPRIELAQKLNRHGDQCKYYLNTADDLKRFPDNTFDFIYSNIVLQHMTPRLSMNYIKEFLRILAPNGLITFQLPSEPAMTLRGLLIRILPAPLLDLVRGGGLRGLALYCTGKRDQPREEMNGIKREEAVRFLETHGAKIVDIQQNQNAGKGWVSFQYCVTKQ